MPEVWIPGSKDPFRPVNPWGRPMPRVSKPVRPALYQVVATRKGFGEQRLGPKMEKQYVLHLYDAIEEAIRSGKEKDLTNLHVVMCV